MLWFHVHFVFYTILMAAAKFPNLFLLTKWRKKKVYWHQYFRILLADKRILCRKIDVCHNLNCGKYAQIMLKPICSLQQIQRENVSNWCSCLKFEHFPLHTQFLSTRTAKNNNIHAHSMVHFCCTLHAFWSNLVSIWVFHIICQLAIWSLQKRKRRENAKLQVTEMHLWYSTPSKRDR